jgi:hypothetical protein
MVAHHNRGEMESSPWGFSLWVKQGGGVVDLGWRRGHEHGGCTALLARWIERGNGDLVVKMGAVECYEGVDAPLL